MRLVGYAPVGLEYTTRFTYPVRRLSPNLNLDGGVFIGFIDYALKRDYTSPFVRHSAKHAVSLPYGAHVTISEDATGEGRMGIRAWLACTAYHIIRGGHSVVYISGGAHDASHDLSRASGYNSMDEYVIDYPCDLPPESEIVNMLEMNRISHIRAGSHASGLLRAVSTAMYNEYRVGRGQKFRAAIILDGAEMTEDVVNMLTWLRSLGVSLIVRLGSTDATESLRWNIKYHIII